VYVAFDVLYRLLRALQYEVQYVRNFTDVDDKIIKRAAEAQEDPLALAGRFIDEFHIDMAALGCLPPTVGAAGQADSLPPSSLCQSRTGLTVSANRSSYGLSVPTDIMEQRFNSHCQCGWWMCIQADCL